MEALTSPRSFLSLEHESSNSRRRKTRSCYYIHGTLGGLQRHCLRPLSTLCCWDPPLGRKGGSFRSSFCSKRRHRLPGEGPRVLHFTVRNGSPGRHELCYQRFPILIFSLLTFNKYTRSVRGGE